MKYFRTLLIIISFISASTVLAGEAPAGAKPCASCHGVNGVAPSAEWPNLAGQNKAYLVEQLRAFRSGQRENPAMAPFVTGLSDDDIDMWAAYYSAQPAVVSGGGEETLVVAGENLAAYCKACHGMNGRPATEAWPLLNGQHAQYLEAQMLAFKSGMRVNGHMQAALSQLGPEQFKALAAFYSRQTP